MPSLRRAREEVREGHTLEAGKAGEGDLRIKRCLRLADVGVGRDELLLGGEQIGAALQQRGGQTGRDFRAQGLRDQSSAARHVAGVAAQQDAQEVFLLFDATMNVHNGGLCGVNENLRLIHVRHRSHAACRARLRQFQRIGADAVGAPGNVEFEV